MVAGAILGLAAGASAGALEGVRRERRFDRYAANYQPDDENAVVLNGQVVGSHNGNGLYDYGYPCVSLLCGVCRVVSCRVVSCRVR
jgi:hypothetical protein